MQHLSIILLSFAGLAGSGAALAAAPTFPADARITYQGTTSDAGVQACTVQIVNDTLARPVDVTIQLPNAAPGNVHKLEADFNYIPLAPGSAVVSPTASGYSLATAKLTSGLFEILTVEVNGDDAANLSSLAITRNFGVLSAKISCDELKPI